MISKLIEVTNQFNWGRFLIGMFSDAEWEQKSKIDSFATLLGTTGKSRHHFLMLDLVTGEGAFFVRQHPANVIDLNTKHQIWVCPMFEPALLKLSVMEWETPLDLPDIILLSEAESAEFSAFYGHRRKRKER